MSKSRGTHPLWSSIPVDKPASGVDMHCQYCPMLFVPDTIDIYIFIFIYHTCSNQGSVVRYSYTWARHHLVRTTSVTRGNHQLVC